MDPEIKQHFDTLEGAVVRLADGLQETNANMAQGFAKLTEAQVRTDATVRELAQAQARTDDRVAALADGLSTLTERVDRLAQLMIRGHTEAAERHAMVIDRLDKLEGS